MNENTRRKRRLLAAVIAGAAMAGCAPGTGEPGHEVTLAEDGGSRPTVAVTQHGSVLAAWVQVAPSGGNVLLARAQDGISFGAPVRVNDLEGDAAPHDQAPAQVAVGPGSDVYVLWQNNTYHEGRRFPFSDLRFARSTDGGRTFASAITVNDDAGQLPASHTFHSMAVTPDGTILVAWIDGRARAAIEAARPNVEVVQTHHGNDGLPDPQIRIARSTDGGRTFSASIVVAETACPCCRTALAIAPDGTVALAWRTVRDGDLRDVVVARSSDGGRSFSDAVVVHEDGWRIDGCPHAGPALAWDARNLLHVAWYTGAEGHQGIHYATSADGGITFGERQPLLVGEWVPASLVALETDAGGEVWAVWDDRRVEPMSVQLARLSDTHAVTRVAGKAPALAIAGSTRTLGVIHDGAVRVHTWTP